MKFLIILIFLSNPVKAEQWMQNGVLVSNVCRSQTHISIYPYWWALPVDSFCRLTDGSGGYVGDKISPNYR